MRRTTALPNVPVPPVTKSVLPPNTVLISVLSVVVTPMARARTATMSATLWHPVYRFDRQSRRLILEIGGDEGDAERSKPTVTTTSSVPRPRRTPTSTLSAPSCFAQSIILRRGYWIQPVLHLYHAVWSVTRHKLDWLMGESVVESTSRAGSASPTERSGQRGAEGGRRRSGGCMRTPTSSTNRSSASEPAGGCWPTGPATPRRW